MNTARPSTWWLVVLVIVGALTVAGCGRSPASVAAAPEALPVVDRVAAQATVGGPETPSIAVSGQGRVLVTPDIAHVVLGVEVRNPALAPAQAEAASKIDAVLAVLKGAGIAEADIRTAQYTIQPLTRVEDNGRQVVSDGYLVIHLLEVTFRDLKSLGARLDQVTQAGATTVRSLQFDLSNPAAATSQARERAIADARARADHLAQLSGVTLGRPISITEGGGSVPPVPVVAVPAREGAAPVTQIEPGQSEVRVFVLVRYAIQ
jgi:uncharacterized protein YggE